MARTVRDAAAMLSIIADRDEETADYRAACEQSQISHLRIGIPRNAVAKIKEPAVLADFADLIVAGLRGRGAEVVEFDLVGQERYDAMTLEEKTDAIAGDFKIALGEYLGSLRSDDDDDKRDKPRSIEDIAEFTKTTAGEEYPERNIARFEQAAQRHGDSAEYKAAQAMRVYLAGEGGIPGALEAHKLDAIVAPTKTSLNYFAACGGLPQITVPLGYQPETMEVKWSETGNLVDDGPNVP